MHAHACATTEQAAIDTLYTSSYCCSTPSSPTSGRKASRAEEEDGKDGATEEATSIGETGAGGDGGEGGGEGSDDASFDVLFRGLFEKLEVARHELLSTLNLEAKAKKANRPKLNSAEILLGVEDEQ
jgi:hypothetical protein